MPLYKDLTLKEYINQEDRGDLLFDMSTNGLKFFDWTLDQVYKSAYKQLALAKKMSEEFPSDFSYSITDGNVIGDCFGAEVTRPDYDFHQIISHPFQSLDDLKGVEPLDPMKHERLRTNLEAMEMIIEEIELPMYFSLQGPFTLATQLSEVTNFLKKTRRDPDFVKALLEITRETCLNYAKEIDKRGIGYFSIAEPTSVTLSPSQFKEYVVPGLEEIYNSLTCWKGLHICGNTSMYFDQMLNLSLDAISLDHCMDEREIIKTFPNSKVLLGNFDPIEFLAGASVEEIKEGTLDFMADMVPYDNHLAALGCNCLNNTPDENLKSLSKYVRMNHRKVNY